MKMEAKTTICLVLYLCVACIAGEENITEPQVYNPDEFLTAPQMIRRNGYRSESHCIETEDGYLLTLHRIPTSKEGNPGNQPVFLQHGLLSSSVDYVNAGNNSLAFILADKGYDVWLGNARGNVYSRAHVSLSVKDAQFWNFSWHEMGLYDVPASLNYIANMTGKEGEILYVGHSMGSTMFLVFSSLLPEAAKNVKAMVAMAPSSFMTHVKSPIKYLTRFGRVVQYLQKQLGLNEFLPSERVMKILSYGCDWPVQKSVCKNVIFLLNGYDKEEFDERLLPVVLSHIPAGASTKTIIHYMQEISKKGQFREFDYGEEGNMVKYNRTIPPPYPIWDIKVPMFLMYGKNDWLATPQDVKALYYSLTQEKQIYEVPICTFNHIDFLWGKHAPEVVYEPLMHYLANFTRYI